jgi:hypothetical protein
MNCENLESFFFNDDHLWLAHHQKNIQGKNNPKIDTL